MAAVLAAGPGAVLSHRSAAELWGLIAGFTAPIHVTLPTARRGRPGIRFHRSSLPDDERTVFDGIPVTTVPRTTLDCAADMSGAPRRTHDQRSRRPAPLRPALGARPPSPLPGPLRQPRTIEGAPETQRGDHENTHRAGGALPRTGGRARPAAARDQRAVRAATGSPSRSTPSGAPSASRSSSTAGSSTTPCSPSSATGAATASSARRAGARSGSPGASSPWSAPRWRAT